MTAPLLRGCKAKTAHFLCYLFGKIVGRICPGYLHWRFFNRGFCHFSRDLALFLGKLGRSLKGWRRLIKFVDDGMDQNSLVVNGDGAVRGNGDPVVCSNCVSLHV